jgi:phosphorylcholine metabolism protein LicD
MNSKITVGAFCALLLVIRWLGDLKQRYRSEGYWREKFSWIQNEHRELLRFAIPLLNETTWWLTSGNLLGLVRHKNRYIPWDDDMDVVILDDQKWEGFVAQVKTPWSLKKKFYGWDLHHIDFPHAKIDLFLMKEDGEEVRGTAGFQKEWPTEYYIRDELFPLQKSTFEGLKVPIPKEPVKFLLRTYGENWNRPRCTKIHQGNPFEKVFVFLLGGGDIQS